jgi:glucose-1-phosphate cytidylyltransferase
MEKMKAVILCGGQGTRLREETEFKPKPMVPIGGMPIVWHIMKIYSHYGIRDFVLCLGYKGEMIKEYFLHQQLMAQDVTVNLKKGARVVHDGNLEMEDWNVTLADTGLNAMTGARLKRIERYVDGDEFMLTYGDGLADINIARLLEQHKKMGAVATLTGSIPQSRFGLIKADEKGRVTEFIEKPKLYDERINGGFYVMKKKVFDYVEDDDSCVLEKKPLTALAQEGQLAMYRHDGFWHCMDTYRDYMDLNAIWDSGKVPWRVWK